MKKILMTIAPCLVIFIFFAGFLAWKVRHRPGVNPASGMATPADGGATGTSSAISSGAGTGPGSTTRTAQAPTQASAMAGADQKTGTSGVAAESKAKSPVPPSAASCYTITYHHKVLPNHSSDDECSHHRNQIKLDRGDANLSSLCIRVNGTPVHYRRVAGSRDEFVIGPVAGPKDVITARFCAGKVKCHEACVYPKKEAVKRDEFLDAIGGSDDDRDAQAAQWEAGDSVKNAQVNKALDGNIRKALEGPEDSQGKLAVFKDWVSGEAQGSSCAKARASADARGRAASRILAGE